MMWETDGFVNSKVDVRNAMNRLQSYISKVPSALSEIPSEEILRVPRPGKWSKQQIFGHLIDSALNNLKRFTDIQHAPQPYVIQSYNQEELVRVNNYQGLPLGSLIDIWKALNKQILNVVEIIPVIKLDYPVDPRYDNHEMKTLAWVICDYVAHMEHHLRQLFGDEFVEI